MKALLVIVALFLNACVTVALAQQRDVVGDTVRGGAKGAVKESIAGKRPKPTSEGHVSTSMPGNIVDVMVNEGDQVEVGQPVLVTEAMKMETEIQSPVTGTVKEVYVQKGDAVSPDETLIEIEKN